MSHHYDFLFHPSFHAFLLAIDRDLAAAAQAAGCPSCGGPLHVANYERQPLGGLESHATRLSLCCGREGCRKRLTPGSVRFLSRKVYLGVIVVLASVIYRRAARAARDRLADRLGVSERTLVRWRRWWLEEFAGSRFWRAMGGRFIPPVARDALPWSLLERFGGDAQEHVLALLRFLAPIAGGQGLECPAF